MTLMDIDTLNLNPIPPGEEGIVTSHAGGEEELCRELFQRCVHKLDFTRIRRPGDRHDGRSRQGRTQSRNDAYAPQVPALAIAFLAWKKRMDDNENLDRPMPNDRTWPVLIIDFFSMYLSSYAQSSV